MTCSRRTAPPAASARPGTSFVFLAAILALVVYLTVTRRDVQELHRHPEYDGA